MMRCPGSGRGEATGSAGTYIVKLYVGTSIELMSVRGAAWEGSQEPTSCRFVVGVELARRGITPDHAEPKVVHPARSRRVLAVGSLGSVAGRLTVINTSRLSGRGFEISDSGLGEVGIRRVGVRC